MEEYDIKGMVAKIRALRRQATALKEISGGIPAVDRNADRILATVRLLEMNVSEAAGILEEKAPPKASKSRRRRRAPSSS